MGITVVLPLGVVRKINGDNSCKTTRTVSISCSEMFALIAVSTVVVIISCPFLQCSEFVMLAMRISESWKRILTGVER